LEVPGATGYTDTDYTAKGRYAVNALGETDLICVHVEATDEASHEGDAAAKIQAIEAIDREIVAPLHAALREHGSYRLMVTPDHPTPLRTKTHSHGFVPFVMGGTGVVSSGVTCYDESTAASSGLAFDRGHELMAYFLASSVLARG
jgi:2,3-bisphosphoglycerate-independent phosphoglycerate mutase